MYTKLLFLFSDRQNPRLTTCPSILTVFVQSGSTSAQVDWMISAVDNDGLQPSVTCDPVQGQFDIGDYSIHCTALDAAGNSDTCDFQVEVAGECDKTKYVNFC